MYVIVQIDSGQTYILKFKSTLKCTIASALNIKIDGNTNVQTDECKLDTGICPVSSFTKAKLVLYKSLDSAASAFNSNRATVYKIAKKQALK